MVKNIIFLGLEINPNMLVLMNILGELYVATNRIRFSKRKIKSIRKL